MLTTLIISGCSICYELIISAVSSYLIGDTTLQYSITIGLYMCAMGLGSYISKYMKNNLFNWFVFIEIGVAIVGGTSALILFYANLYLETYQIVMYIEIIVIGTFVGAEIPILTRIIEDDNENLRVTLSSIFSFDYIGGLVGSIAFPIILLPHLGYFATSFLIGCMNTLAATLIIFKYSDRLINPKIYRISVVILFVVMLLGMLFSDNISSRVEDGLYRDRVIFSKHTKYQDTKYQDNVLILGGGDGLAVREILKYKEPNITLVDLDKDMVNLCKENKQIKELNKNSLNSDRLTIVNQDAYQFLKNTDEKFDVIIVDLPDPNNESLNKLYTNVFYRLCSNSLTADGIMTVQSTSPYYAANAFWCINDTLESEGFYVKPYHLQVPSFGDWGFNLASKKKLDDSFEIDVDTRFLDESNLDALFEFGKDEMPKSEVEINSLSKPRLITYYSKAVRNWE